MRVEGDNVLTYSINFESWAQLETEVALSGTQTPIVVQQSQTRLYIAELPICCLKKITTVCSGPNDSNSPQ